MTGRERTAVPPVTTTPTDQLSLRRANLSRVLVHLREHGPRSRATIATGTGLHKATVSSLVDELLTRRLVREVGLQRSGAAGRPGRVLALDGATVGALGVEINVDYLGVHGIDLAGRPVIERRTAIDAAGSGPDGAVDQLVEVIRDALRDLRRRDAPAAGVVVAVPGLIDVERGLVVLAPNLGWRQLPLAERLRAALPPDLPVGVDNDANLAALAEYTYGVAAGTDDLVYLTGEVGVGGGMIVGGRLLRGAEGFSGEVGHLPVDPAGRRCGCGRTGCWETKVGLAELVRLITPDHPHADRVRDPEERLREIGRWLSAGEPAAEAAVAQVGRWLGLGGAILVNLVNPRVIVLGGYFATLADRLVPTAQRELDRLAVAGPAARCRFVASNLGFTAAARGAAGVVVDRVLADPTTVGTSPSAAPRGPSARTG
ncbi:ROK family transcriptional regulator [Micromonospora sp. CPCC 205556]|uniref:ROK family transcriptional regulator n=1 Tax=Micromonospora sp. CPCC 205556 TaxID=3122398 RepID=UPI002FF01DD2